jgi:hypothetical protein
MTKSKNDAKLNNVPKYESKYWISQPLLKEDEYITNPSIIIQLDLSTINYTSDKYNFNQLDVFNNEVLLNLNNFINNNYFVSDTKKNTTYDKNFILWLLTGNKQSINLGLELNNKLCGFIHGHVSTYQLYDKQIEFVEVSFLTVDKKHHHKEIAELLIKELTKQFNLLGYQSGLFSTTKNIGKTLTNYKTFYRPINYLKLTKTEFIDEAEGNIDAILAYYAINGQTTNKLVKINPSLYHKAYDVYCEYMEKYIFHRSLTYDEFVYWHCSENVRTYVFLDDNNEVVDLLSYYITHNNESLSISICNLYLYTSLVNNPMFILKNLVLLAKQDECDVVLVSNMLENDGILLGNKYIQDTTETNIYLYNYKYNPIKQNELYYHQF